MAFNTVTFIFLFLPLAILLFYAVEITKIKHKKRIQNTLLLALSLLFFGWAGFKSIYMLLAMIVWNYMCGILHAKWKWSVLLGIIGNLAQFAYMKILPELIHVLKEIFTTDIHFYRLIIPIGFSFVMFHCISYLMDIYNGKAKPCRNPLDFALYITFFPKLVQGPIVKYCDFEHELNHRMVGLKPFAQGLERFIIGLAKKVLVADVLAETVRVIFENSTVGIDVPTAWIGSILFTLQIYLDFSGYSDMAIGLCKMFGFNIQENFDHPYFSKSISEFWRRWHISLGAWFREYLYIPLGGSRTGNVYLNLFVVFLATGIWHGTTLPFILWGIAHGVCVMVEKYLSKRNVLEKIPTVIRWGCTMFVVGIGWIVFMAPETDLFCKYIANMLGTESYASIEYTWKYFLSEKIVTVSAVSILIMVVSHSAKVNAIVERWNNNSLISSPNALSLKRQNMRQMQITLPWKRSPILN